MKKQYIGTPMEEVVVTRECKNCKNKTEECCDMCDIDFKPKERIGCIVDGDVCIHLCDICCDILPALKGGASNGDTMPYVVPASTTELAAEFLCCGGSMSTGVSVRASPALPYMDGVEGVIFKRFDTICPALLFSGVVYKHKRDGEY